MVDVIGLADAVFHGQKIADGGQDLVLDDMRRDKLLHPLMDLLLQFILRKILGKDLHEDRIIDHLADARFFRIKGQILIRFDHVVRQHFQLVAALDLDVDVVHAGVLDLLSQLAVRCLARLGDDLAGVRIDDVFRKTLSGQTEAQVHLLVVLVAADMGEVIAAFVKQHPVDQGFRGLQRRRLAGTDLLVQLEHAFSVALRTVLLKRRHDLGLFAEKRHDLLVASKSESAHQHRDRHFADPVHTRVEHIVGIGLEFQPGAPVRDDLAREEFLADLVVIDLEIHAGGADDLGNDDALRTVDDKRTRVGH